MPQKKITMVITKDPEDERWYNVRVPSLPGCVSQGRTVKQAVANGREAVEAYLQTLDDDGLLIPTEAASVAVLV